MKNFVSKCCGGIIIPQIHDEGTAHFQCAVCGKPCDICTKEYYDQIAALAQGIFKSGAEDFENKTMFKETPDGQTNYCLQCEEYARELKNLKSIGEEQNNIISRQREKLNKIKDAIENK